jgi:hypothetical protein
LLTGLLFVIPAFAGMTREYAGSLSNVERIVLAKKVIDCGSDREVL